MARVTSRLGAAGLWGVTALALTSPSAHAAVAPPATTPTIAAAAKGRLALVSPSTGIRVALPESSSQPSWSANGRTVAFVRGNDVYTLAIPSNTLRRLTNTPSTGDSGPSWSPDGTQIAWAAGHEIRLMSADGTSKQLLAGGAGRELEPAWDIDGSRVLFATDRDGNFDLWAVNVTTTVQSPVVQLPGDQRDPALSPDGTRLAFASRSSGNTDIWVATDSGGSPTRLTTNAASDGQPAWSPSSGRIAFGSSRGGGPRIWSMAANGSDERVVKASRAGDYHPSWANAATAYVLPLAGENLPDLDQRAPAGLVVIKLHGHFHLGFDSAVDNLGTGPLWIRGIRPNRQVRKMRADQLVELDNGRVRRYRGVGQLQFEAHPPHHHWHYEPFERFELRRANDFAMLVRDRKSGFCLADHYGGSAHRVDGFGPPRFLGNCGLNKRRLLQVEQGSSIGYTDRYPALFHGQDVRLTGVPAGRYVIVHRANPARELKELRYDNNAASLLVRLTWPRGTGALPRVRILKHCPSSESCS